jgi:hypothetical protein
MGGNRKYGFRRGNANGRRRAFFEADWTCDGCLKRKSYRSSKTGTLDGRTLCDRCYDQRTPAIAAAKGGSRE